MRMHSWIKYVVFSILVYTMAGCTYEYVAKPKAYHRIKFPEKSYVKYESASCPFSFEMPGYGSVKKDSLFFEEEVRDDCWLNISFRDLNGTIHMTYKAIDEETTLADCIEDAHTLTFKHARKADFIDESKFENQYNATGMIYEVGGDAASAVQFYVTDETSHFLRGSLYFNSPPNADSLAPVITFVKDDMMHLLNTFQWHNP